MANIVRHKISDALKLKTIYFTNYDALFHISHLVSKPRMVLASDADYQILLQCVASIKKLDLIVYVDITEQAVHGDEKENIKPKKGMDNSEDTSGYPKPDPIRINNSS